MPVYGLALAIGVAIALSGCGKKEQPPAAAAPPVAAAQTIADAAEQAPGQPPQPLQASAAAWTPEAMEELLAPVALFPDVMLGSVLVASTNPQEVLDAGNWLLQNPSLTGNALDEAAKQVGFTPPVRALLQSPEVIDMMCLEMGWTTELGQAYVNDQAGVLDAVQRLRTQAKDVGNLKSSEQMKVATEVQQGQPVITVSPPSPEVVYVPQYDPVAVYAPAPAVAAPATTTTTATTAAADTGHSTGALVATGLLSFGAGMLVANIFDDDDDDWYKKGYYNPRYYGPPMPYYPPYPYRPSYGNGYYPSNGYNRPPGYGGGFNNSGNIVVVNPGGNNNGYWDRYDNNRSGYNGATRDVQSRKVSSPITAAKPNRPELDSLNAQARQGPKRPAPAADAWKGQTSYAGAQGAKSKVPDARPGATASGAVPKVQGSYAGSQATGAAAKSKATTAAPAAKAAAKPTAKPAASTVSRPEAKPSASAARATASDRGYAGPSAPKVSKPASKPAAVPSGAPERAKSSAISGAKGSGDRAASDRGKKSMPAGAPSKAKGAKDGKPR